MRDLGSRTLNYSALCIFYLVVRNICEGNNTLVFCYSKALCRKTCRDVSGMIMKEIGSGAKKKRLLQIKRALR